MIKKCDIKRNDQSSVIRKKLVRSRLELADAFINSFYISFENRIYVSSFFVA